MEWNYFDIVQHAKKRYSRVLEPVCRRWGLTRSELDVLLYLANNPGFDRAADIVAGRGMAKSQVSSSLVTLEQRGMVCRSEDSADRRTVRIRLTEEAAEPVRMGREAQERFFRSLYEGVTREERDALLSLMTKVRDNLLRTDEKA